MAERLLTIDNLDVTFGRGDHKSEAVRSVSLTIDRGQTVALVGESGSGKSVTALSVMQLLPYPLAQHPNGSIRYRDQELVGAGPTVMQTVRGNQISMIFQEPMTSLNPLHSIERQISESLKLHKGLSGNALRARVLELLELVGIRNAQSRLNAYPHELSGGQRQRVMIAMALANEPELLIADEPTTALDVTIQVQILDLLVELQQKMGMGLLLITHDLGIVRKMADVIHVMTQGQVVETGSTDHVFNHPQHSYTQHLLAAEPAALPIRDTHHQPLVLAANNIHVRFPIKGGFLGRVKDHVNACNDISLTLRAGRTLGVVGESGSGKTTLGMALLRLIKSEGDIIFKGITLHDKQQHELRKLRQSIQIVFQDPYGSLSPRLSILQIVEEGLKVHQPHLAKAERIAQVSTVIQEVGLDVNSLNRFPHEFSGGQRQRIAIARAMVLKPSLVILDEPTSALDMSVQAQIVALLQDLQTKYQLAYVFISHDLKVVRALSDDIIVMQEGKIVESGSAYTVVNHPKNAYTRELMRAAFELAAE